jgi:hypothetical protein
VSAPATFGTNVSVIGTATIHAGVKSNTLSQSTFAGPIKAAQATSQEQLCTLGQAQYLAGLAVAGSVGYKAHQVTVKLADGKGAGLVKVGWDTGLTNATYGTGMVQVAQVKDQEGVTPSNPSQDSWLLNDRHYFPDTSYYLESVNDQFRMWAWFLYDPLSWTNPASWVKVSFVAFYASATTTGSVTIQ